MSAKDKTPEEVVLGVAAHFLRELNIQVRSVEITLPDFVALVTSEGIADQLRKKIREFHPEKLGIVACAAVSNKGSTFRTIIFQKVFPKETYFDEDETGYDAMYEIAFGVIVTTMYEILMTAILIKIKQFNVAMAERFPYKPKQALEDFVANCKKDVLLAISNSLNFGHSN